MADSMLPKPSSQRIKDWANNVTPGSPQDNRLARRPSRKRSYNEFAASEQASEVSMDSGATNRGLSTSQRLKILLEANLFRLRPYGIYDMWHIDKKPMSAMTELENALLLANQKAQEEVRKNQRSTTKRAAQFTTQWTAVARHMATVREMMSGQGSIMPQLEEVNVHLRRATHWGVEIAFVSENPVSDRKALRVTEGQPFNLSPEATMWIGGLNRIMRLETWPGFTYYNLSPFVGMYQLTKVFEAIATHAETVWWPWVDRLMRKLEK